MNDNVLYLFVKEDSQYNYMFDMMFKDILSLDNCIDIVEDTKINNATIKKYNNSFLRKYTFGLCDYLYVNQYKIKQYIKKYEKLYDKIIILYLNSSFMYSQPPFKYLKKLKDKYKNTYWVLYYLDVINSFQSQYANILRKKGLFDLVYSFETENSEITKWSTPYSIIDDYKTIIQHKDFYFCGADKGRGKYIEEIAKKCKEQDINFEMDLVLDLDYAIKTDEYPSIRIKRRGEGFFSYDYLLGRAIDSNCILELVQEGQEGFTLRFYEAICYNKKLLTNNKSVLNSNYYDERYIQYFNNIECIDWQWVKEKVDVDFGYAGEYSPIRLLNNICERI